MGIAYKTFLQTILLSWAFFPADRFYGKFENHFMYCFYVLGFIPLI